LFVYAGAEVALAAGIPLYLKDQFGIEISTGLLGTALFLGALATGRLSTGFLLRRMQPPTLFLATCLVSLISLLGLFVRNQSIAMASFVLIGLGFANIAPLISATFGSGVLPGPTGIPAAGGAIVPLVMGGLADRFGSVEAAFLVPVAALVYLTWVASADPGICQFSTKMTRKIAHFTLVAGALAASSAAWAAPRDYRFDGKISREVLENYLSRSITMTEMYRSPGSLEDDLRMLKNIGAKFAGRTIYLWGREARINDPKFLGQGRDMIERVHQNDSDVVMQAAAFEIVTEEVSQIPIPDWVFREFGQTGEKRNFDYTKMLFPDGKMVNHWRRGSSVPDICQPETKMWFYFLIGSYVNIGIEAIHVGQLDLMGRNDPEYRNWDDLLQRVRRYAAKNARRHFVIFDAHVPKGGPIVDGRLLLDFHSFPLRPKEVSGEPGKATLAIGYSDALYRRSRGGVTPSGWKCEHLPYLVEFDNFGGTRTPGEPSQTERPSIFTWGYDEITWFSHQPEPYRNEWLRYAWKWLKENDPDGFLQMPGGRMLTNGPTPWYFANTASAAFPPGFSQEVTIKAIWSADR
jgi:hypothetical protein